MPSTADWRPTMPTDPLMKALDKTLPRRGDLVSRTDWENAASGIRDALDAAGYEVRPKLTAEVLAAAMELVSDQYPGELIIAYRLSEMTKEDVAAAILAALAAEASGVTVVAIEGGPDGLDDAP